MSEIPAIPNEALPASSEMLAAGWPLFAGTRTGHAFLYGKLKPLRDLPTYCNPIALFFAAWILMLASLCFHISYPIYPYLGTPFLIFFVSSASLLLGFFACTTVLDPQPRQSESASFVVDVTALWRLNLGFTVFAVLLMAANWITSGPPPALGDPSTYLTYGKLRQIFFPMIECIAVNATLDTSRLRRYLFITFALGVLALHVSRGLLLITFLQMFFLFSLRTAMGKRKQYLLGLGALAFAVAGITIFGNLRTAHDIFIEYLQIRAGYADWPMAFLWVVSYISIPFSNLCWMVAYPPAHGPTFAFLYPLLPGFFVPADPYADAYDSINVIDNASTYLQTYALDFSYFGIYFVNLFMGLICGWMVGRAYRRHILVLPILLTNMSIIFFTDRFFNLAVIIQIVIQVFIQKCCFRWVDEQSEPIHPPS
jgi:hypothetical protein